MWCCAIWGVNVFSCQHFFNRFSLFADLLIQHVNLQKSENQERHRTEGFIGSKTLVVRRGAPFSVSLQLAGRPFNPSTDSLRIKVMLGRIHLNNETWMFLWLNAILGLQRVWTTNFFLSPLPRPSVHDDTSHLLQEGYHLLLDSLHWRRQPEPLQALHLHLLSCLCFGGTLQVSAECPLQGRPAEERLWQIHPALQPLVSWWVNES